MIRMKAFKKAVHAVRETGEVMGGWLISFYFYVFGKPNGTSKNTNHIAVQNEQNRTLGLGEASYQQQVIKNTTSAQFRNHNGS